MARNARQVWSITSVDPEVVLDLRGYVEGGVSDTATPLLGGGSSLGSSSPVVQWVAGGARRVRLRSRFVGEYNEDDVESRLARLRRLRERDPQILRAPRVLFAWPGVRIVGLAEDVQIDVVGLWPNGRVREVAFEVVLVAAEPVTVQVVSPVSGETLWTELRDGETFEALAARLWGDPLRGDLIRRANPDVALTEAAGDRVRVLEREHPRSSGPVRPVSAAFRGLRDGSRPWEAVVDLLGAERGTVAGQGGLPWARLPEVLAEEV